MSKKQLDILFVQGNASKKIYQDLSRDYSAKEVPHWSGMLAQHCRLKGYSVQILDCEAEDITAQDGAKLIKDINAKLVVFPVFGQQPSASTQNMQGVHEILEELEWSCKTLLIGLYPSANSRKCLIDEKCSFVCQGEGPRTIISLIQTDLKSIDQLEKVPGLWFRNENYKKGILSIAGQESGMDGICFTKPEPIISQEQLHIELPGTAWDLLPMKKYRTSNWHALSNNNDRQPFAAIYTSLGCPYRM